MWVVFDFFLAIALILAHRGKNIRKKREMPQNKEEVQSKSTAKSSASYSHSFNSSASWGMVYLYIAESSSSFTTFSCLECSREDVP